MRITLKEIAKLAGVSPSTVSRVMNNSKPVKDELRKKVLTVLKEYNYLPYVAQNFSQNQDRLLIGVIYPQYSNTVMDDYIVGINRVCKLYGYDTIIGLSDGTREDELRYLELFNNQLAVQGTIFMGNEWQDAYSKVVEQTMMPVVLIGQTSTFPSIPSVHVDNVTASYEAVIYLLKSGHRRIGMIKGKNKEPIWNERFEGYKKAMEEYGISVDQSWVVESGVSVEEGERAMRALLEVKSDLTAVFCSTDSMAIGAMTFLKDHHYKVPDDISVFGFDGIELSKIIRPQLSTIGYSAIEIGMTATRNLVKLCKGEEASIPPHINVLHHVEPRDSTRSL